MSKAIVWFRQDLRCFDNLALKFACDNHAMVAPVYILDTAITTLGAAQLWWLHHSLKALERKLKQFNLPLILLKGNPIELLPQLIQQHKIDAVYWNRCYEPETILRDQSLKALLKREGTTVQSYNGSLLNEPWTITNKTGGYFKVFTPYWKTCQKQTTIPAPYVISKTPEPLLLLSDSLESWGLLPHSPDWAIEFKESWEPGEDGALKKLTLFMSSHLKNYTINRDYPAMDTTTKLSPHLHFGEISPWQIWREMANAKLDAEYSLASIERLLSEVGWREFSYHLLYHFPKLPQDNFKAAFDAFPWHENQEHLQRWQKGITGYPIVDAGMRELWRTGYMHNRVRMIVASFLTKDLFIDWRIGASWFFNTLLDADLANNSASWQWVAGSGADASPYFRIFNPTLQSEKFDPLGIYIKKWVPELKDVSSRFIHAPWHSGDMRIDYPKPVVIHEEARRKALHYYELVKNQLAQNPAL